MSYGQWRKANTILLFLLGLLSSRTDRHNLILSLKAVSSPTLGGKRVIKCSPYRSEVVPICKILPEIEQRDTLFNKLEN